MLLLTLNIRYSLYPLACKGLVRYFTGVIISRFLDTHDAPGQTRHIKPMRIKDSAIRNKTLLRSKHWYE